MSKKPQKIRVGYDIEKHVDSYFAHCESTKQELHLKNGDIKVRQVVPSMVGLAYHLGISTNTLYNYMDGKFTDNRCKDSEELERYTVRLIDTLARARQRIELAILDAASSGDIDSKVAALRLGQLGYSTKAEVETRGNITVTWEGVSGQAAAAWGK